MKTGRLIDAGHHKLGAFERYRYSKCVDCETMYPHSNQKALGPSCNGAMIDLCPWCRPDSKPWTNGRGL